MQTDNGLMLIEEELAATTEHVVVLEVQVKTSEQKLAQQKFRLCNMLDDDKKVALYTGFQSPGSLQALHKCLGPSVDALYYSSKHTKDAKGTAGDD